MLRINRLILPLAEEVLLWLWAVIRQAIRATIPDKAV
jgi:hypothetical protein